MTTIGRREILTGVSFTDTSLPVVKDDPVLPDAGALMLLDTSIIDPGVPAPDDSLYNVAWRQAEQALGSGTSTTLGAAYKRSATFDAADGLVERTAKGGIHFIISQTTVTAGRGGVVALPDAIKTYLLANPSHGFYFSAWLKLTRVYTGTAAAHRLKLSKAGNNYTKAFKALLYRNNTTLVGVTPTAPGNGVAGIPSARVATGGSVGDNQRVSLAQDGPIPSPYYGTTAAAQVVDDPDSIADFTAGLTWGAYDQSNQGGSNNDHLRQPSQVLYRMYFEDLTLSGRTAAAVDALDSAAYTAAFASGGRFAGDTHTDPATIP